MALSDPSASWNFELADSELAALQHEGPGRLRLLLAAALLRDADGRPGHAPGLVLTLDGDARASGEASPGRLRDGRLGCAGQWHRAFAVPGRWQAADGQPLQLELVGPWGERLLLSAQRLQADFADGRIDWRPWLHC
ncbi:MAG: hypothetical protein KBC73_11160 [Burkholderiaceae bacterium]|nr:hypothetical protein [Burkholderiaceae bacterium]